MENEISHIAVEVLNIKACLKAVNTLGPAIRSMYGTLKGFDVKSNPLQLAVGDRQL